MLYPDLLDIPIEQMGGYVPALAPSNLPSGASPFCQDVDFPMAAVRTRNGLKNAFPITPIPANATVNGLKSYVTPTLTQRLLAWDSQGNLYKEGPQGTLTLVAARPQGANSFYRSTTLFGREYQAFFNLTGGMDIPRQFDDTNWDRITQEGPGKAPTATDDPLSGAIVASPGGLATIASIDNVQAATEVGNVVTLTLDGLTFKRIGTQIIVAGVGGGYDGTYTITAINAPLLQVQFVSATTGLANLGVGGTATSTQVSIILTVVATAASFPIGLSVAIGGATLATYDGTFSPVLFSNPATGQVIAQAPASLFGTAASGGGTLTIVGNIPAGLHLLSVAFITEQSFITKVAVPASWTAAGAKRVLVTNIPTGPPYVLARLLVFSPVVVPPASSGVLYSLPAGSSALPGSVMLVNDNVTTSVTVDFADTVLISGFNANYLLTELELGELASVNGYNSRLIGLGERNRLTNLINLSFDGGFYVAGGGGAILYPNGWTSGLGSAGGNSALKLGLPVDWGDALAITGDGLTATRGKFTQSAYLDYLGVPIISRSQMYGVRVRVARNAALNAGTLHINLQSTIGGFTTVGLSVTAAQAGLVYAEFTANLTDVPLPVPPTDLLLQVYADGKPNAGGNFLIDSIELYPLTAPFNYSTARFSHAFNPESFDATTGQVQVRPNDGQQLRASFPIRSNFYLAKDHYLAYVTDDGQNEPASWPLNEVSATVGICGPNAVDWTEEWGAFAERSGVYLCWGGDPEKISQEIEEDASRTGKVCWRNVNWNFGHTIWVRIDQTNKQILVGVPVNGATSPNVVFVLDYKWLQGPQDIASSPQVIYSSFTGKILSHGRGRRWVPWNITSNSFCFAERADGTAQPFFGNGVANGKIYQQVDVQTQASDDGAAINSQYATYYCPSHVEEQGLRLTALRKLLGYLTWRAFGSGNLAISVITTLRTTPLRPYQLQAPSAVPGDAGRGVNVSGERFSIQVGTNTAGSWFQLEKIVPFVKKSSTIPVRGRNV